MHQKTLLAAGLAVLLLPLSAAADRVVEHSAPADPDVRVRLEAFKGEIRVRTGDVATVELTATITPDDGPIEDLDLVEVRFFGSGRSISVEVEYDERLTRRDEGWFGGSSTPLPFVDLDVVMPDGGSLQLESHKSRFDVQAPAGGLEIESHKGEGRITRVRGDFELDTHKGDFDVEIERLGDVRVDTHKGDVELRVAGGDDFRIDGRTHKGSLRFRGIDVPVERGDDEERRVDFETGSGRHRIELETHKGTIVVDFG